MKKYVIQFMCVDTLAIEEEGISGGGTNFGIYQKAFNSKEDAEKYLEETMIPEDKANLEKWYGLDGENLDLAIELRVDYIQGNRELVVYDKYDRKEINTTIYEIMGVDVDYE